MEGKKYIKVTVSTGSKALRDGCVTRVGRQGKTEVIKLTQKGKSNGKSRTGLCGCRRVNFADQKVREAYQKVNRMLGGR